MPGPQPIELTHDDTTTLELASRLYVSGQASESKALAHAVATIASPMFILKYGVRSPFK
jgi:hypothetical protein